MDIAFNFYYNYNNKVIDHLSALKSWFLGDQYWCIFGLRRLLNFFFGHFILQYFLSPYFIPGLKLCILNIVCKESALISLVKNYLHISVSKSGCGGTAVFERLCRGIY